MQVTKRDGSKEPFDFAKIERLNEYATFGLNVDLGLLRKQIQFLVHDGMSTQEIFKAQINAASGLISVENQDFTYVAARYLLADLFKRVNGTTGYSTTMAEVIAKGIGGGRYNPAMLTAFDMDKINAAVKPGRDLHFDYFGLQNVVDRYLMRLPDQSIIELPQQFLMRVAMGASLNEDNPTARAIEFYDILSKFDFVSSTPTLFNSGTPRSQLSSCYLNTVADQISAEDDDPQFASIYGTIEESARLSKYAGGIGTSWTRVRGEGSLIKGTNGRSSGVVPYLKVYNDTAVAVNQGGKRKGSFAPYLEPWHPDFMAFCELKKEFGDDRMRAHDIFPAAWLPDLFMKRVQAAGTWSFFEPHLYPELHELYGDAFEQRYEQLEAQGKAIRQMPVLEVWKTILTNLFETGHPWITFKDECNNRSPQSHVGTIHSSNLCTEITLNTSDSETAVCNLGSINLANHITSTGKVNLAKLQVTIRTAIRMLDNVIDLNYYPSWRARESNLKHRPIGLGMMGYAEALVMAGHAFDTQEAVEFGSAMTEAWSYYAIEASADLAQERGSYQSFQGSTWSKGLVPLDTSKMGAPAPKTNFMGDFSWGLLREKAAKGMRNSNVMAIAPTATISILANTTPCTEPPFERERVEGNISGKFKVVDPVMRHNKPELVRTVWEVEPRWIIEHAAARQIWIDQAQSTNIFVKAGTRGSELAKLYISAWEKGLKTTYYLRSQSKTAKTAKDLPTPVIANPAAPTTVDLDQPVEFCSITDEGCISCQ
jgi:ribonucleoside-diphosphate reductase alpha chain